LGISFEIHKHETSNSRKAQPVPISTSSFFGKPFIQQALICAVEASVPVADTQTVYALAIPRSLHERHHTIKVLLSRCKDHDSGVEAIGPSNVGCSVEVLGKLEELRDWSQRQDVGVEVDDLSEILLQTENMKFRQGGMQIRSTWEGKGE
jgi:hypothetical protein